MNPKKAVLDSIHDEVRELHPLLKKLLVKLPGIKGLEYTHGPDEMGADFVLAKEHASLGHTQYVGVVAKVGKIHQNFRDIERQIEECFIERHFRGGKERIHISEVWVIATKNITGGAKRKIHEKYKSHSIEFICGTKLESLIDKHLEVFWQDLSLQVSDYLNELRLNTAELDRALSLLGMSQENFYVEHDIYEILDAGRHRRKQTRTRRRGPVNMHREIEREPILLIEGGMGAGKSKLLRQLIAHYTNPEVFKATRKLPISVSYQELTNQFQGNLERLLRNRVTPELEAELDGISYLILVDGLDEKRTASESQLDSLRQLKAQLASTSSLQLVITTRPIPGLREANRIGRDIALYRISPLSLDKTLTFIRRLCTKLDVQTRIIEDLKKSPLFRELPRSPIAAILLAKLLNESTQELPSNMTELYLKYSELMLGRWDMDKGMQSEKEYEAMNNVAIQLAHFLITNELDFMPVEDAKDILKRYLDQRNLDIDDEVLFRKLVERTEMVVANTSTGLLRFKHRTFAEFFYAKGMLRERNFAVDNRAFHLYWANSYYFYFGLNKDCPQLLDDLMGLEVIVPAERWISMINMGNYLLAAYASPYDVITKGVKKSMLDAANLYLDTIKGREESPFSHLTQMQLLWLLQMLIRSSYSYQFFHNALHDAAISIAADDFDPTVYQKEIKPYALFFLNVANLELDEHQSFDLLLELYTEPLPIDLAMALRSESKSLKERTRLMKKQDKRIKKLLKDNRRLAAIIDQMYERPIIDLETIAN